MGWGGSLIALLSVAGSDFPRGLVEMGWHIALLLPWHPGRPVLAIFLPNLNLRFPSQALTTSESDQAGSAEALPWGIPHAGQCGWELGLRGPSDT